MPVGNMDRRITFQRRTGELGSDGQPLDKWEDVLTVWASVKAVKGRNYYAAAQEQSEATHTVMLRRRDDIEAEYRIDLAGRLFKILPPVATDERTPFLILSVTELIR